MFTKFNAGNKKRVKRLLQLTEERFAHLIWRIDEFQPYAHQQSLNCMRSPRERFRSLPVVVAHPCSVVGGPSGGSCAR